MLVSIPIVLVAPSQVYTNIKGFGHVSQLEIVVAVDVISRQEYFPAIFVNL